MKTLEKVVYFYNSLSTPCHLPKSRQHSSVFFDENRRESSTDDSNREEFKKPFDYSFLDKK